MNRRHLLSAAGLLVAATLSGCGDSGAASGAGDVVVGHLSDEVQGDETFVLLPSGRIDLTVGKPTSDAVSADQADDGEEHAPPSGGSFVPVSWSHDPFAESGSPAALIAGRPLPADVSLVVDGKAVDLGSPYEVVGDQGVTDTGVGTMYVAVDEAPDEIESLTVSVDYDGLTQTVDPATGERDAGAAAPLYDGSSASVEADCPSDGWSPTRVDPDVACHVGPAQRAPYLPGSGWADDGRTWLVVGVTVDFDSVDVGGVGYDVTGITPHLTLDGAKPVPTDGLFAEGTRPPSGTTGTYAFDASVDGPDELTIALDLTLAQADSGDPGPAGREVTLTQTVALR